MRLETRFRDGRLLVRVYPDTCTIDTFESTLSESEVRNLQAYWQGIWRAAGVEADERTAWRGLVASHGSGRAAWAIGEYVPANAADRPQKARPEDVVLVLARDGAALPEEDDVEAYWLAVWAADGDLAAEGAALQALRDAVGAARADELVAAHRPFNLGDRGGAGATASVAWVAVAGGRRDEGRLLDAGAARARAPGPVRARRARPGRAGRRARRARPVAAVRRPRPGRPRGRGAARRRRRPRRPRRAALAHRLRPRGRVGHGVLGRADARAGRGGLRPHPRDRRAPQRRGAGGTRARRGAAARPRPQPQRPRPDRRRARRRTTPSATARATRARTTRTRPSTRCTRPAPRTGPTGSGSRRRWASTPRSWPASRAPVAWTRPRPGRCRPCCGPRRSATSWRR